MGLLKLQLKMKLIIKFNARGTSAGWRSIFYFMANCKSYCQWLVHVHVHTGAVILGQLAHTAGEEPQVEMPSSCRTTCIGKG